MDPPLSGKELFFVILYYCYPQRTFRSSVVAIDLYLLLLLLPVVTFLYWD